MTSPGLECLRAKFLMGKGMHKQNSPVILLGILGSYLFLHIWGKYFIKIGKISAKIHEIGKIKAIFGLGMTPI